MRVLIMRGEGESPQIIRGLGVVHIEGISARIGKDGVLLSRDFNSITVLDEEDEETPVMNPEEFERKIKEALTPGDPPTGHHNADEVMCDLLESLGYGAGVEAFRKSTKWYS